MMSVRPAILIQDLHRKVLPVITSCRKNFPKKESVSIIHFLLNCLLVREFGRNAKFFKGDIVFSGKEEIFTKNPDMADSCQQETPFPPTAFLWFGFNMIPRQCQRRNLCCDG